jgi:L-2-hydroxyglutarate oxidase LhgO
LDEVEAVIIGAGVIGLAAARALALAGREVIVLERAYTIGFETSSRNSEVIHGGLYYPQGSLKAVACVDGRELLYAYCREHHVPHAQLGKLIVATGEEEIPGLEKIEAAGRANGVANLEWLNASAAQRLEPEVRCVSALLSPSTGIIDSHALMLAYQGEAEAAGAVIAFGAPVRSGRLLADGFELRVGGDEPTTIRCRALVNAAGLYAPGVARSIDGIPPETIPPAHFCRGVYFTLSGKTPFRRLVYPTPVPGGLGVHLTSILPVRHGLAPMSNGSTGSIMPSIRGGATRFTRPCGAIGRGCATAHCGRVMPVSGRRSPALMRPPPILSCKGRGRTVFPVWSTSTASSRRA